MISNRCPFKAHTLHSCQVALRAPPAAMLARSMALRKKQIIHKNKLRHK